MRRFALLVAQLALAAGVTIAQESSNVKWYTLEEALKLNTSEPRKIFIDVYTDWCGWCKKMDSNTFSNPLIANYLNKNFYAVKFNAEGKNEIAYKGQIYKNQGDGQRSTHDFAIALLQGKLAYPSIAFMDGSSNLITFLSGYLTPSQIEPIMVYIMSDAYKTQPWDQFSSKFVSKLNSGE